MLLQVGPPKKLAEIEQLDCELEKLAIASTTEKTAEEGLGSISSSVTGVR